SDLPDGIHKGDILGGGPFTCEVRVSLTQRHRVDFVERLDLALGCEVSNNDAQVFEGAGLEELHEVDATLTMILGEDGGLAPEDSPVLI
ncbi:MAG TPA: hypothetical protein PK954_25670, partial [Anaerolineales bacterium]|nr:hypothetical protein [Anaerolineales bacterium]